MKAAAVSPRVTAHYTAALPRDHDLVAAGRAELHKVLIAAGASDGPQFDCHLVLGEALQNATDYGTGETVRVRLTAFPAIKVQEFDRHGGMSASLRYETTLFDPTPIPPNTMRERGRGLFIITELTASSGGRAKWQFSEIAGNAAALLSRAPQCVVRVSMVYRWA